MNSLKTYVISSDILLGKINLDLIHNELESSDTINNFTGVSKVNDSLLIYGDSFSNESECDSIISSHDSVPLIEYKKIKFKEINDKTGNLILNGGFTFSGKVFSLSKNAQLNLLGVDIKRNDGILPLNFNTIDDMDVLVLNTPEEVDSFFMTALGTKKAILDSANELKVSVRLAVDKSGVDSVIDNR